MGKTVRRICSVAAIAVAGWVGPAYAQSVYTGTPAPSAGAADTNSGVGAPGSGARLQVAQAAPPAATGGRLAVTGTDVMSLVAVGTGAIALGFVLKRRAEA